MLIRSTFNHNYFKLKSLVQNHIILKRSITTLVSSRNQVHHTYVTLFQSITITKRFMLKKAVEKSKECVGDNCKEALQGLTTAEPLNNLTTSAAQSNSLSDNTVPSTTEVIKSDETNMQTEATMANQTVKQSSKQVEDKVKQAVQDSYNKDKEPTKKTTTVSKEAALEQDKHLADKVAPLSTPFLDALKKQGFNLTDESPTIASSSNQDSKPNTTSNPNKMIDAYLSKHSIVQNQSAQGQNKNSTISNTSTQAYSSSDAKTNSVSPSNNTEDSLNNETSSKDIPNPPIPETTFTEQSMSTDSNLTSFSFSENSESVKETEDLAQKALEMKLIVRRDAPDNPQAGSEHMTVKGNRLYTELQMKEHPQLSLNPIDLSNTTFQTGTLTIEENKTLIPRSDQSHPVISTVNGKILIWGYLTSHDGDGTIKIADKQMDGAKTVDGKDKPQFYKPFEQPVEVSPENFTRHYDKDVYLQDSEINKKLKIINSDASQYEPIPYQETGLTREELEAMVAKQIIEEGEKTFTEEKKPSTFLEDDDKKKKNKKEEAAKKNKEKQIKESQDKKVKAKFDSENKPKIIKNDE